jgi:general secretion pathway protein A
VLSRSDLRQQAQRITGLYHLEALSRTETLAYVRHRLRVAGATTDLFSSGALREIHRQSGGIPRIINVICDRALLGAFTREEHRVTGQLIRRAASEVYGRPVMAPWVRWLATTGAVAGVCLLGLAVWRALPGAAPAPPEPAVSAAVVEPPASTAPAVEQAAATAPALAELLALSASSTSTDAAFTELLSLWGASYEPGTARPCDQVADQGLQCVAQQGTFAQLKLIDRPAILALTDASGTEHQVVLEVLDGNRATLAFGGARHEVDLADLATYWFGEFLVVWRPSIPMAKQLRVGMRGDDVRWLREGLSQLEGTPADAIDPSLFDGQLERLVQEFQRSRRLTVDGIAGVQTQLVLDSALGAPNGPTLEPGTEGGA